MDQPDLLREAKEYGFSDRRLAQLLGLSEMDIRGLRKKHNIVPVYKIVDTCAAEFEAFTPYLYSTYERPFYKIAGVRSQECRGQEKSSYSMP